MENYIVINGKKAELTKEQLEQSDIKIVKKNPFTRKKDGFYYYITVRGELDINHDDEDAFDNSIYDNVYYFNDKDFAQQVAWHELLNRKLLKYAYEHKAQLKDKDFAKYEICWNCGTNEWDVVSSTLYMGNTILFSNRNVAKKAIEDVVKPFMAEHPDFVW